MADAEQKKLIKFGNSSYIITLPKNWIDKHKLKKGDTIHVEETSESDLVLTAKRKRNNIEPKSVTINVDGKEVDELRREVTSAYIDNYSEIILAGKTLKEKAPKIIIENIGMEMFEQTTDQIILKDILDFDAIYAEKIVRRLDNLIRSMFEDLRIGLEKESFNEWIFKEMKMADAEINKLYFLLLKIIRKGQSDPLVAKNLDMSNKDLSDLQWFILHLEYLGDEIKRVARTLMKHDFSKEEKKNVLEVMAGIEASYLDMLKAYYSDDKPLARKIAGDKRNFFKMCEKNFDASQNKGMTLISEKAKWMIMCVHNFAKIVAY